MDWFRFLVTISLRKTMPTFVPPSLFPSFYRYYVEAFPSTLRKAMARIMSLLEEGKYRCVGRYVGNQLAAYALCCRSSNKILFLDYLQVFPSYQNQGHGKALMDVLMQEAGENGIFLVKEKIAAGKEDLFDGRRPFPVPCDYHFPCAGGNIRDDLLLYYLPPPGKAILTKEESSSALTEVADILHCQMKMASSDALSKTFDTLKDLSLT